MKINTDRASAGLALDFARNVYGAIKEGGDVGPAVRDEMVRQAIARFTPHVAAALRRAGLDVPDGEPLNIETIIAAINAKTGLDIQTMDPDGIAAAVNDRIASRLSEVLGVTVTNVTDAAALREEVKAAALEAIQSGRANALVSAATIRKVRKAATWARAGVAPDDRRRWLSRWYAAKYRVNNKLVWD